MNRDQFMEKILDRLEAVSDDRQFEACACDVLRPEWSNLVPAPGGGDTGVDGAFVDNGDRGILIATTGKDVIGNVQKNLKSHLAAGKKAKKVLVVTTRKLTNPQCRNIEKRIEELGFQSAHYPYGQQAIADRLYRNSRWLRELLGLSGVPSALSRLPRVIRPFRNLPLVGRERELNWLSSTQGDKLVVGQPGIGKTFLCQELINRDQGLYAVSDDIGELASAIRDQDPSTIVVEDAHERCELIRKLRHYREEYGATFSLLADCWPGSKDQVREALGIAESSCLELSILPRKSIVDLIRSAGLLGPNRLHHVLVQQSAGCPGRAAMLTRACLTSADAVLVVNGSELAGWVYARCTDLAGESAIQMLAAFALGGRHGMSIDQAAAAIGATPFDVRVKMEKLAFGGIVHDVGHGALAVYPEALRCILVRDFYFSRPIPLALNNVLPRARSKGDACKTLVGAYDRGAPVSTNLLVELLENADDWEAWEDFAWTNEVHAQIVIELHPELIDHLSMPLLVNAAGSAVPLILQRSIGDERPLHSHPDHGLRKIEDWIVSGLPGSGQPIRRRKSLWSGIDRWLKSGKDQKIALRALQYAVSLKVEFHEQSAEDVDRFTFSFGTLTNDELHAVGDLWPDVLDALSELSIESWHPVLDAVDEWAYPTRHRGHFTKDQLAYCEQVLTKVLDKLKNLAQGRPGVLTALKTRARHNEIDLEIQVDRDFVSLFPDDPHDTFGQSGSRWEQQQQAADALAEDWRELSPSVAVAKLVRYTQEVRLVANPWPDYSAYVIEKVLQKVDKVLPWVDELIEREANSQVVASSLVAAAERNEAGWRDRANHCLNVDALAGAAVNVLLLYPPDGKSQSERLLERAREFPKMVEHLCRTGKIAIDHVETLLTDADRELSGAIATGMWHFWKDSTGPGPLRENWEDAVCRSKIAEYDLCLMLEHNAELSYRWLRAKGACVTSDGEFFHEAVRKAGAAITGNHRLEILESVNPKGHFSGDIISAVIGDDAEMYRQLLGRPDLARFHLAPLQREPDDAWARLATVALDCGVEPEDVAKSGGRATHFSWGAIPAKYDESIKKWSLHDGHSDERIRKVAEIAKKQANAEKEQWRTHELSREFR